MNEFDLKGYLYNNPLLEKKHDSKKGNKEEQKRMKGAIKDNEDHIEDLKKDIKNLEFYDCKNFLEMAEIIKSSKIFIGNLSFGYTLAEGLKVNRLLESSPDFPLVYPNGGNGYDFYYQKHFEKNQYIYRLRRF